MTTPDAASRAESVTKMLITSNDSVFWMRLIDWLNAYPVPDNRVCELRLMDNLSDPYADARAVLAKHQPGA